MTTGRMNAISSSWFLLCIVRISVFPAPYLVKGKLSSPFWSPKPSITAPRFGIHRQSSINNINRLILTSLRGGSAEDLEDDDIDVEDNEEEDEDEDEETETAEKIPAIASNAPVRLIISTNWGNSVIDQTVELTPARTRDVASLKKSLSKQLPGRPPVVSIDLVFEGRILEDETLVDELFDDEDEEDDDEDEDDVEEGNEPTRKLTLSLVPPVDPKFATELAPKLVYRSDDDDDDDLDRNSVGDVGSITTDELVDAYYMNQVAMSRNAQLLTDPSSPSSPYLRMELQEQARQLRDQLQAETPVEVWEKSMEVRDEKSSGSLREEWRGQRYRSTKGGVSRQIRTIIQTNMNVDWENTIQLCLLFLFLGYFGGKKSFSRQLLYWGAPLSFLLQSRPWKIWYKTLFHMQTILPSIFLSLLPAPALAIITLDMEKSCIELYGEDGFKIIFGSLSSEADVSKSESVSTISEDDEEEESDSDESEEDQDEYDSEEEEYEEEDYDSDDE